MKVVHFEKLDGFEIIKFITDQPVDPLATLKATYPKIKTDMSDAEVEAEFMANRVFANSGQNTKLLSEADAEKLQTKLDNLKDHQRLGLDGTVIPDYTGEEYWQLTKGKWAKGKIGGIGEALPKGAIFDKDISAEQRSEIAAQEEEARIKSLSPEEKAREKETRLAAAKREAVQLKNEAEIVDEEFDAKAWFQERKAEIEKIYA